MPETKITSKQLKKSTRLKLSGDLTIESAGKIKAGLLKALGKKKDVVLEMEDVDSVDLTFLQTLCSALKSARKKGIGFGLGSELSGPLAGFVEEAGFSLEEEFLSVSGSN